MKAQGEDCNGQEKNLFVSGNMNQCHLLPINETFNNWHWKQPNPNPNNGENTSASLWASLLSPFMPLIHLLYPMLSPFGDTTNVSEGWGWCRTVPFLLLLRVFHLAVPTWFSSPATVSLESYLLLRFLSVPVQSDSCLYHFSCSLSPLALSLGSSALVLIHSLPLHLSICHLIYFCRVTFSNP